ncbi:KH domain-containing protein [Candidatus Micrarchaeota archaeon]|nr:KH domain-containing protein [Candidatus Micrarchaeota archaeon]
MDFISVIPFASKELKKNDGIWQRKLEQQGRVSMSWSSDGLQLDGEPGDVWAAKQVLQAMNWGFPPQKAFKLFNDNFFIEVLNLKLLVRNEKAITRYKGRIIGVQGKAKRTIEELSGAFIAISDEDVAILGEFEDLQDAKEGILRLLEGATHSTVFAYLEKRNREKRLSLK